MYFTRSFKDSQMPDAICWNLDVGFWVLDERLTEREPCGTRGAV